MVGDRLLVSLKNAADGTKGKRKNNKPLPLKGTILNRYSFFLTKKLSLMILRNKMQSEVIYKN